MMKRVAVNNKDDKDELETDRRALIYSAAMGSQVHSTQGKSNTTQVYRNGEVACQ